MALNRATKYPGRFDNPTSTRPQGAFKNRTSPTSQDGSYLEKDWANDIDGFFASALIESNTTPNGDVDEGGNSQLFDAVKKTYQAINKIKTSQFVVEGTTGDPLPSTTPTGYLVGAEMAFGWVVTTDVVDAVIDSNGNLTATSGIVEYTFNKADNATPNAASLFASVMRCTNAANSVYVQDHADGSNGISITETATTVTMVIDFSSFAGGKVFGVSEQLGRLAIDSTESIYSDVFNFEYANAIETDVTGSRALGVTYTNNKPYPVTVSVEVFDAVSQASDLRILRNGRIASRSFISSTTTNGLQLTIFPGDTYSVLSANLGISEWLER